MRFIHLLSLKHIIFLHLLLLSTRVLNTHANRHIVFDNKKKKLIQSTLPMVEFIQYIYHWF